jgi:hypothetical protein
VRSEIPARLSACDTVLDRLAQHFKDMAAESTSLSRNRMPWWISDTSRDSGMWLPPISLTAEMGWCEVRKERAVTGAGWVPVRLAMRWLSVSSIAAAQFISRRMAV